MSKELAAAIRNALVSSKPSDRYSAGSPANLVDVLDAMVTAIRYSAEHLGTGNAATQMGAIELLAKEVKEGTERVASGLHAIAEAIENRPN